MAAVHHAEVIAHRVGEPFGTLILALSVTVPVYLHVAFALSPARIGLVMVAFSVSAAGAAFVMPAGHRHAEAVGPDGVQYLVGRRNAPATNDESRTS